jgi:hypothetical protein
LAFLIDLFKGLPMTKVSVKLIVSHKGIVKVIFEFLDAEKFTQNLLVVFAADPSYKRDKCIFHVFKYVFTSLAIQTLWTIEESSNFPGSGVFKSFSLLS